MSFKNILKNRILAGLAIGLLISAVISGALFLNFFKITNLKLADNLYTKNEPSDNIVIIAIDEASTQPSPKGLGRYSQWSRENYINLLDVLKNEQPKVITFDILFNKPTETIPLEKISVFKNSIDKNLDTEAKIEAYQDFLEENSNPNKNIIDENFAKKISEFKNIVLGFMANPDNQSEPIFPLKKFSKSTGLGNTYAELDEDGILRKAQPFFNNNNNLAVATVMKYLGTDDVNTIKLTLEDSKLNINYFSDPFGYKMISFVNVTNNQFPKDTFKDKIVLIGITAFKDAEDRALTPRSNAVPMSGVEVWANEIQTILEGKFLMHQSKLAQVLTIAAVSIGLTVALNYLGILFSLIVAIFAAVLYFFAAHFFYRQGLILNMFYPFVAIVLAYLASWVYKYFIADRKKRELKSAFGHYVSDELVDQISKNPDMVKLGGEKKIVTVFFSDIKDSTAHSEKTAIESWVSQINEYFTVMENVLKKSGGTLDKYEGDAIMGFWNAPISQTDHVLRAYATAIGMQRALAQLHKKWQQEGKPLIEFRIGINTGEALVGNFGSASRFDYTVMGDTVNTASRLESAANKTYGTTIIVAGFENATARAAVAASTADDASAAQLSSFFLRELDTVYLPGKKEPVTLFELLCLANEATPDIQNFVKIYHQGLAAYRCKDFASAIKAFMAIQTTMPAFKNDIPTQILFARCQKLQSGENIPELNNEMIFRIVNK